MMREREEPLRPYLTSAVSEARKRRLWRDIDRGLDARPRSRGWRWMRVAAVAAVPALAAAAALGWLAWPEAALPSREGAEIVAGASAIEMELSDGSALAVQPESRLRVSEDHRDAQRVVLERGAASFQVTRDPSRTFEVRARTATVRVIGTRFEVELIERPGTTALAVRVEEGTVRVDPGDHVLTAGQQLVMTLEEEPPAPLATTEPVADETIDTPEEEEEERPSPGAAPRATRLLATRTPPSSASTESADGLLERAQRARARRDDREAARLYTELVREHPSDPRAGVAGFELGRLYLDRLDDPRAAADALGRSLRHRGPHREDARARLVEAYARMHQAARCRRARADYLRRHPNGVHADVVRQRCQ